MEIILKIVAFIIIGVFLIWGLKSCCTCYTTRDKGYKDYEVDSFRYYEDVDEHGVFAVKKDITPMVEVVFDKKKQSFWVSSVEISDKTFVRVPNSWIDTTMLYMTEEDYSSMFD